MLKRSSEKIAWEHFSDDLFSIDLYIKNNFFITIFIQNGGERANLYNCFFRSTSIGGHFSLEILNLEQKIKMISYLCTIDYGTI